MAKGPVKPDVRDTDLCSEEESEDELQIDLQLGEKKKNPRPEVRSKRVKQRFRNDQRRGRSGRWGVMRR